MPTLTVNGLALFAVDEGQLMHCNLNCSVSGSTSSVFVNGGHGETTATLCGRSSSAVGRPDTP
jgi:hypothetical protein